jgi:hypothetical protein
MAAYEVELHRITYPSGITAPVAAVKLSGIVAVVVVPQANRVG